MNDLIRNCLIDEVIVTRESGRYVVTLDCMTDKGATFISVLKPDNTFGARKNDWSLLQRMLEVNDLETTPPRDNYNFGPIYRQLRHRFFRFKLRPWKRDPSQPTPGATILKMKPIDPFPYPEEVVDEDVCDAILRMGGAS
ncbi:hypothetical protein [Primorskyibacter sp. S87]|uniref:hypothetical protein n=1 Tax=Primorskyibacter sp. S87 TaxID=3415126 RepID=UPI003C7B0DAD